MVCSAGRMYHVAWLRDVGKSAPIRAHNCAFRSVVIDAVGASQPSLGVLNWSSTPQG